MQAIVAVIIASCELTSVDDTPDPELPLPLPLPVPVPEPDPLPEPPPAPLPPLEPDPPLPPLDPSPVPPDVSAGGAHGGTSSNTEFGPKFEPCMMMGAA